MKNVKSLSILTAIIAVVAFSCSKGSGTTGATGATGATGPAGPSNVYYSAFVNADLVAELNNGDSEYVQTITDNTVTQSILDSGMIISYVGFLDPNSGDFGDVEPASEWVVEDYEIGSINYTAFPTSEGGSGVFLNGTGAFRYIIVPGTIVTSSIAQGYTKAQIRNMTYAQLSKLVGTGITPKAN